MWNDYFILWNYAAVRIKDIRYMKFGHSFIDNHINYNDQVRIGLRK